MLPLAISHWAERAEGLKPGLTLCAQPRRILAQQLCERVRLNRKMDRHDKTVGYKIARDSSRNSATKLLYCTEAIVAMMMQQYLVSSNDTDEQDVITTVIIDEVHNRSAHSDYVLALTLAAMQKHSHLRLVLMSAGRSQPCARKNPTLSATSNERCCIMSKGAFWIIRWIISQFAQSDGADCDYLPQ